jgi:2-oxoisovalerate dehydrogenase E1 component beta subunit
MPTLSFADAITSTLKEVMREDERVIVLGEDVEHGGVFRLTEGLHEEFGGRVIDTPLAESTIIGVSIGAACNGFLPVPEIQFADFIFPAMNQIICEAAKLRYRSRGEWGCPITIRAPYGGGIQGGLYHSQSVEAFFGNVPGLKVVVPSTPADAAGLLRAAIYDPDPVLYFEHKAMYRLVKGEVNGSAAERIGRAAVRREGSDLTIFAYGLMVHHALTAAEELAGEGIECCVVDLRTLVPLDRQTVVEEAKKTGKILVVYEANLTGGFGAEVAAVIAQEAFEYLDGPVMRLAGPDVPAMPYAKPLEDWFMVSPQKIAEAARLLARY